MSRKNWQLSPYMKRDYNLSKQLPEKPKHLDEMWEVAKELSKNFGFVRVDLYEYRDQVYFSELTFFPTGGLMYRYNNEGIKVYGERWWEWKNKQNKFTLFLFLRILYLKSNKLLAKFIFLKDKFDNIKG